MVILLHAIEMAIEKIIKNWNFKTREAVGIGMLCELYYASNLKENKLIKTTKILNIYKLPTDLKFININKSFTK